MTFGEIIRVLIGRWLVLMPFAAGVALVPVLARLTPERYRSEALIVGDPQQVPDTFASSQPLTRPSKSGSRPSPTRFSAARGSSTSSRTWISDPNAPET